MRFNQVYSSHNIDPEGWRRIAGQIESLAMTYGGTNDAASKQWLLDQILQLVLGEEGYDEFLRDFADWDIGIPPWSSN